MSFTLSDAAAETLQMLDAALPAAGKTALSTLEKDIAAKGKKHLDVVFPGLVRRFGRSAVRGGLRTLHGVTIDFDCLRHCDLVAARFLACVGEADFSETTERLFANGDFEERRMILKALALLPIGETTATLLETAHRTNDQVIFEAGFTDSTLALHALSREALRRAVLKAAFIDIDPARLLEPERVVDPELSRMLLDLMSEREAAGRSVWRGTLPFAAHAPSAGVEARILGDLWHGQDTRRESAARAAAVLRTPRILAEVAARRECELHPPIAAILAAIPA